MDFVGPFVGVIDTYLIAPLARQIKYLTRSNDNVNDLQDVVQRLTARRDDEESKLKTEENAGQVKTAVAHNWFEAVDEIEKNARAIETEFNEGRCVNCWSRYKLSKTSLSLKQKAIDRLDEQFVAARQPSLKSVMEMPTEPIQTQPSTKRMLKQILDCISEPEIGIIGVYGMGGVGKTTLAKHVNNHFKENSHFETVIMVTVSATPNIQGIQASIGKRLGVPENSGTDVLYEALNKKKFLVILDDVWSELKLEDVGIPRPPNHKGSKILLTSRNQGTCTDMGASQTIKVQPLSEVESWELFVEVPGVHIGANDIKRFAEKIVRRCEGLPLAIVTVAHAMANKHGVGVRENALREMKQSAKDLRGMREKVFVPLKFSFDRLENDMLRSLFLYCACFPEDYDIEVRGNVMLNYCIGEGLVDKLGSLKAARDKGEDLIASLKIACMLEDGGYEGNVKMHDMMRELALWITSPEYSNSSSPKFLIRTSKSVKEAPESHEWVDATKISLIDTKIEKFPELGEKMCRNLSTLLLRWNLILTVIPPTNFLQHMDHLTVLDLSDSLALEYIPKSLSCLVNLQVLRLQGCEKLRELPALGMLQQLQVLSLQGCKMLDQEIQLGSECMGSVSNLRYLDVECSAVSIPIGAISRLHKLEELSLFEAKKIKWRMSGGGIAVDDEKYWDQKGHQTKDEERRSVGGGGSSIATNDQCVDNIHDVGELFSLTSLTSLSISLEDVIISYWFKSLANKMTDLLLRGCRVMRQDALQALSESQNLWRLRIEDCVGVTCVPPTRVRFLEIEGCEDLEVVLNGTKEKEEEVRDQDSIGSLHLERLPKLKRICGSLAPLNCFAQLRYMEIRKCNSLKMVFTKGMPRLFNKLEYIVVCGCDAMEVIFEEAEDEDEDEEMEGWNSNITINHGRAIPIISPFPKLKIFCLFNLPRLADLCTNHILYCPLIEEVGVINCPRLKQNPLQIRNAEGSIVESYTIGKIKVFMKDEIQAS